VHLLSQPQLWLKNFCLLRRNHFRNFSSMTSVRACCLTQRSSFELATLHLQRHPIHTEQYAESPWWFAAGMKSWPLIFCEIWVFTCPVSSSLSSMYLHGSHVCYTARLHYTSGLFACQHPTVRCPTPGLNMSKLHCWVCNSALPLHCYKTVLYYCIIMQQCTTALLRDVADRPFVCIVASLRRFHSKMDNINKNFVTGIVLRSVCWHRTVSHYLKKLFRAHGL
jgi:hypothetical protein